MTKPRHTSPPKSLRKSRKGRTEYQEIDYSNMPGEPNRGKYLVVVLAVLALLALMLYLTR